MTGKAKMCQVIGFNQNEVKDQTVQTTGVTSLDNKYSTLY